MTAKELIPRVLKAKTAKEVFSDISNWKPEYKQFLLLIHPDRCSEKDAAAAAAKLNEFKLILEEGTTYSDEVGKITYKNRSVRIQGDKTMLKISIERYKFLMSLMKTRTKNLEKYLPESVTVISDTEIEWTLRHRGLPISAIGTLPQEHANWIFSRMLEFSAYMHESGHVHAGINPNSIFIYPEGHGLCCISFYHLATINAPIKTICGEFEHFYPTNLFKEKKASPDIDIELSKRTTAYVLGDKSGLGVRLRKTHDENFLNFLSQRHEKPVDAFLEYRKFLDKYYPKKFHVLNV